MLSSWMKNKKYIIVTGVMIFIIYAILYQHPGRIQKKLSYIKTLRRTTEMYQIQAKHRALAGTATKHQYRYNHRTDRDGNRSMVLNNKETSGSSKNGSSNVVKNKILLVICTSFKYTKQKEKLYQNTMINWPKLGRGIQPVLFIDNTTIAQQFKKHGWHVYSTESVNIEGIKTPVLKQMFGEIQRKYDSHFVGFANADIIFDKGVYTTMVHMKDSPSLAFRNKHVFMFGRRTDVKDFSEIIGSELATVSKVAKLKGKLHKPYGADLFITNNKYPWKSLPELVIGRVRFDNWILLRARKHGHATVDVTKTVLSFHQQVDKGVYEKKKSNEFYINENLLNLYYKNISYSAGYTMCASYYTVKNSTKIQINVNKVPTFCNKYYRNRY